MYDDDDYNRRSRSRRQNRLTNELIIVAMLRHDIRNRYVAAALLFTHRKAYRKDTSYPPFLALLTS